jgi:hypothetical protein
MPIQSPKLDDRAFDDLVEEAKQVIRQRCPEWTDLGASDPGVVLIELFAYLTDVMLYRLNRLPEKAYIEFLSLIGVRLAPPGAAVTTLRFTAQRPPEHPIEIARGTRVTVPGVPSADTPVFVTADAATIPAGGTSVEVTAHNAELVEGELAGTGSGRPGLSVVARRPPMIAPTGDPRDLVVGVEARPEELGERAVAIPYDGRSFRVWTEVDDFATTAPTDAVYVVDRLAGRITFAPAARRAATADGRLTPDERALASVPPAGREIRLWYRRGGGPQGNVAAGTLTVLKDPVAGVEVTNPVAATGGLAAESLANALVRGPQDLHSLNRAVTARDFELNATSFGAVSRARALTRARLWSFAQPGQVEVVLVPELPAAERPDGRASADALRGRQTAEAVQQVQALLDERRPLGTECLVGWAGYKGVTIKATVHVRREEDVDQVRRRVLRRLNTAISPLPGDDGSPGWGFGQPLRVSDVYFHTQSEPGVRYVDEVELLLDEVPDQGVAAMASDGFQDGMWYAGAGPVLFTSRNDGRGWEAAAHFPDEQIGRIEPHPEAPGMVAAATGVGTAGARVYLSEDCGQSWREVAEATNFQVNDLAWVTRDGLRLLLIATTTGLYEVAMHGGATPVPVLVDTSGPHGFYAVAAAAVRGFTCVIAAAQDRAGVFFSRDAGRTNTFRNVGLSGTDARVLAVRRDGPRAWVWAGHAAPSAGDPGTGCHSWELGENDPAEGWVAHGAGWTGGSCYGLAFPGSGVLAATHHAGVMVLRTAGTGEVWTAPDVNSGLPLRDPGRFEPVNAIAASAAGLVLAGGDKGIVLTRDGRAYQPASRRSLTLDDVTVPPTWLLASGEHQIQVVAE